MGIVRMGPPEEVLDKIREIGIKVFIETGTYKAQTCVWASKRFDTVYTVEASKKLHNEAVAKYGNIRNIKFTYGISKESLRDIINEIDTQAVFWFDAHWSGGETFGNDEDFNKSGFRVGKLFPRGIEFNNYCREWIIFNILIGLQLAIALI